MKKFCDSLKEHTKNIIHFENTKMLLLTKKGLKSYQETKVSGKEILEKFAKTKIIENSEIVFSIQVNKAA